MADPLSMVFAALADLTRRDMVARLTTGDATVSELADLPDRPDIDAGASDEHA